MVSVGSPLGLAANSSPSLRPSGRVERNLEGSGRGAEKTHESRSQCAVATFGFSPSEDPLSPWSVPMEKFSAPHTRGDTKAEGRQQDAQKQGKQAEKQKRTGPPGSLVVLKSTPRQGEGGGTRGGRKNRKDKTTGKEKGKNSQELPPSAKEQVCSVRTHNPGFWGDCGGGGGGFVVFRFSVWGVLTANPSWTCRMVLHV